jgi:hypothetical protein
MCTFDKDSHTCTDDKDNHICTDCCVVAPPPFVSSSAGLDNTYFAKNDCRGLLGHHIQAMCWVPKSKELQPEAVEPEGPGHHEHNDADVGVYACSSFLH